MGILIAVVAGLASILVCVCIWCGWNSLKTAIDVVDASADFLADTKRVILVPFVYFVILIMFFFFYLGCIGSVYSMGDITADPNKTVAGVYIPQWKNVKFGGDKAQNTAHALMAFLTFGLIWFVCFLQASSKFVCMVTASTYYFSSNSN